MLRTDFDVREALLTGLSPHRGRWSRLCPPICVVRNDLRGLPKAWDPLSGAAWWNKAAEPGPRGDKSSPRRLLGGKQGANWGDKPSRDPPQGKTSPLGCGRQSLDSPPHLCEAARPNNPSLGSRRSHGCECSSCRRAVRRIGVLVHHKTVRHRVIALSRYLFGYPDRGML